jgi:hypothetical protein
MLQVQRILKIVIASCMEMIERGEGERRQRGERSPRNRARKTTAPNMETVKPRYTLRIPPYGG